MVVAHLGDPSPRRTSLAPPKGFPLVCLPRLGWRRSRPDNPATCCSVAWITAERTVGVGATFTIRPPEWN